MEAAMGYIEVIYRESGKEQGRYYNGLYRG